MAHLSAAILPAYNEEKHIGPIIAQLKPYVDIVIVCDDGSIDNTKNIAEENGAIVISHGQNMGYGSALASLFKEANNRDVDVAVTIDADGQHNPSEIKLLIEKIDKGYDIVIGSRFLLRNGEDIPSFRRTGIKVINSIFANGSDITDSQSGYRAYSKKALETIQITETGMGASTEILLKAQEFGLKICEVPISIKYLEDSSTQNPIIHGAIVLLSTIKIMSIRHPLLFFGVPGFLSTLVAGGFWLWTVHEYTTKGIFPTNLALVGLAATQVGFMLMTTALIIWVMVTIIKSNFRN